MKQPDCTIITVDGTSGSGKGTIAAQLAAHFGYHLLDSGALYRLLGLAARRQGWLDQAEVEGLEDKLATLARQLPIQFLVVEGQTCAHLGSENVERLIRTEQAGMDASTVARYATVRQALLACQQAMAQPPGLVADGRDMGTVVFPQAQAKIFLNASADVRAERRLKQLQQAGKSANLAQILSDIQQRDRQDMERAVAPLRPADGALVIDCTDLSIDQVMQQCLSFIQSKLASLSR